jgi:hypothetical protein
VALAITKWWIVGWGAGVVVVLVAAALLLAIIALGRRIAGQAEDIVAALDGATENTGALFDITRVNLAIDRITRGLHGLGEGGS